MKKIIKSLNLSEEVIKALEKKAKQDERSVSWLANSILAKELQA